LNLRKVIMDKVSAELKSVNAAFPGREFRVADVSFGGVQSVRAAYSQALMQKRVMAPAAPMAMDAMESASAGGGVQTAQKMVLTATVTFAALAPLTAQPVPAAK
jgi:hypothetical protein